MLLFDSIKNKELKEAIEGFRQLRKEHSREMAKLSKKYPDGIPEEQRKMLEDSIFSRENFEKVLPSDSIISIKSDMINEMIVSENTLYNLNYSLLKKLGSDYKINFNYIGRCASCGSQRESRIPVERPVMDYKFVNDPVYFNEFFDYITCPHSNEPRNSNELTQPLKTLNIFALQGGNEYNVKLIFARKKSEGRIIPKIVEKCAGKLKDIRDIYGLTLVCQAEEDCKRIPQLLLKYHGDDRIKCRDFFEIRGKKGKSRTEYENARYFFYINKKGEPKKDYLNDPLPLKIRTLGEGDDKIYARYRGLHMPIEFHGTVIEVQVKDLPEYQAENDPNSPLFHETYAKQRGRSGVYHEEYSERSMRKGWGKPEYKLEDFLYGTGLLDGHSPDLYVKDMLIK